MEYEKPYIEAITFQAAIITLISGGEDDFIDWDEDILNGNFPDSRSF